MLRKFPRFVSALNMLFTVFPTPVTPIAAVIASFTSFVIAPLKKSTIVASVLLVLTDTFPTTSSTAGPDGTREKSTVTVKEKPLGGWPWASGPACP